MMWVMIKNIYLKFEVDTLRNKEVIQKQHFFLREGEVNLIILVLEL
jgi:hypothetical protein